MPRDLLSEKHFGQNGFLNATLTRITAVSPELRETAIKPSSVCDLCFPKCLETYRDEDGVQYGTTQKYGERGSDRKRGRDGGREEIDHLGLNMNY